jgi:hypothetical protein
MNTARVTFCPHKKKKDGLFRPSFSENVTLLLQQRKRCHL